MKEKKPGKSRPQRLHGGVLPLIAGLGGLAALTLNRMVQGQRDAAGLLPRDCAAYNALWGVTLATLLALGVCAGFCGTDGDLDRNYPHKKRSGGLMLLPGALAILAGVLGWLQTGDGIHKAACVLGVCAGAGLLAWGIAWLREREPKGYAVLAAGFWLAASLVDRFRGWSQDPQIADYCFRLLAAVWSMLGAYYLAGFPLGQGRRRRSLFFCWSGAFLCLLGAAGSASAERIQTIALALWLVCGSPALKLPVQPEEKE